MAEQDAEEKVQLYVYDLTQGMAKQFSPAFLGQEIEGIWHTGIVVFGSEYFYGGGIQRSNPGTTIAGHPTKVINLGTTCIPKDVFHEFLREISSRFTPETYSLLNHNCNNFTSEAAQFLTGEDIPDWITGLPDTVLQTPLGAMLRPMIENMERQMKEQVGTGSFGIPMGEFESEFASSSNDAEMEEPNQSSGSSPEQAINTSDAQSSSTNSSRQSHPTPEIVKEPEVVRRGVDSPVDMKEEKEPLAMSEPQEDTDHIHYSLGLESIRNKTLLSEDEKAEQYVKLIQKFSKKEANLDFELTETEIQTLKSIPVHLKDDKSKPTLSDVLQLFDRLINEWSPETLFSVVALLRLLVLRPHANSYFASDDGGLSTIYTLIMKVGLSDEETIAKRCAPVCLMTLCLLSNMFSVESTAQQLCLDECVIGAAICALSQKTQTVRLMGATVLFNCSLFLPKTSDDISSQIACALQESTEEEKNKIPRLRMLLALLHLAYCNTEIAQLLKTLQYSPSIESGEVAVSPKIKKIVADIEILLEATEDADED